MNYFFHNFVCVLTAAAGAFFQVTIVINNDNHNVRVLFPFYSGSRRLFPSQCRPTTLTCQKCVLAHNERHVGFRSLFLTIRENKSPTYISGWNLKVFGLLIFSRKWCNKTTSALFPAANGLRK